jgi:hypothetical protein
MSHGDFAKSKNPEDLEETLKEYVLKLRSEKTLNGFEVYGFVLETDKGVV